VGTGDSVSEGDILQVELDAAPTSKETIEVVVSFADISESKTLPEDLGGDGNYLFVFCTNDPSLSVINSTTDNVDQINLSSYTSAGTGAYIFYRYIDKTVHIIDGVSKTAIDADPTSNTFKNVISSISFNLNIPENGIYNQIKDFVVDDGGQKIKDLNGNKVRNSVQVGGKAIGYHSYLTDLTASTPINTNGSPLYLFRNKAKTDKVFPTTVNPAKSGNGRYNPINGLWYWNERGKVGVIEIANFSRIANISAGTGYNDLTIDYKNNIVISCHGLNGTVSKIDGYNNTYEGGVNLSNPCGQPQYTPASGFVFVPIQGTNQLAKIDPTKSPTSGNFLVKTLTIGNYVNTYGKPHTCINQIML
jgi:hypothetical protein